MAYIPHTDAEVTAMLKAIGLQDCDELFREIPQALRSQALSIPAGMNEMKMMQLMQERASQNKNNQCFIGAGAYEHYIPAAVWELTSRGEYLTSYTPYQAEASQGNLQLIYEFQSMMSSLLGMDVANASLYDGASALAEAVLMSIRCQRKKPRCVLVAGTVNPRYAETLSAIVKQQDIEIETLIFDPLQGCLDVDAIIAKEYAPFSALVISQPNFLGQLEAVDRLCDWAKQQGALVVACVNPLAMALLKEPGQWGEHGADIVCGEGQPLGIPLASGGPYFGFIATKMAHIRQMPGRIVGRTVDSEGKPGFTLTLQAREQHIRRSKATSNICTNQGLLVTAATIYMSLMGAAGLASVAKMSHQRSLECRDALMSIDGVDILYQTPFFHEFVCRTAQPANVVLKKMAEHGIHAGYSLAEDFPDLANCFLVCVTETKQAADLADYRDKLARVLKD